MKIKHIASGLIFGLFLSSSLAVFASDHNPKTVDAQQDKTVNASSRPSTEGIMPPGDPI